MKREFICGKERADTFIDDRKVKRKSLKCTVMTDTARLWPKGALRQVSAADLRAASEGGKAISRE